MELTGRRFACLSWGWELVRNSFYLTRRSAGGKTRSLPNIISPTNLLHLLLLLALNLSKLHLVHRSLALELILFREFKEQRKALKRGTRSDMHIRMEGGASEHFCLGLFAYNAIHTYSILLHIFLKSNPKS